MSAENGKICCNCRHCKRLFGSRGCKCMCDIDEHRMSYVQVMTGWCKHWAKGKQEEESADAKWQKRIKEIKADILRYKSDCEMAEDAVECKMCNKTMFDSILRIIDKHTKGVKKNERPKDNS